MACWSVVAGPRASSSMMILRGDWAEAEKASDKREAARTNGRTRFMAGTCTTGAGHSGQTSRESCFGLVQRKVDSYGHFRFDRHPTQRRRFESPLSYCVHCGLREEKIPLQDF